MSTETRRLPKTLAAAASLLLAGLLAAAPASAVETPPAPAPAELAAPQSSPAQSRQQIIDMFNGINAFRKGKGLQPLRIGANASLVAQEWSNRMAATTTLEHSSGYATDKRLDPGFVAAAENVAYNSYGTGRSMVDQWINSPGHNANMSRPADNVMGVGIAFDKQDGFMWGTTTYYQYGRVPSKTYATAEEYLASVAPAPSGVFKDVPAGRAFAEDIRWMAEQGISTGWPDGTFRPLDAVRRDAMAAFIYRLEGSPQHKPQNISPFSDVSPGQQFYKEMTWLAGTKITTGWPDGTFRPLDTVRRDAMAAFLYRSAGSPAYTPPRTSAFSDVSTGNQFYKEISWLADQGISTGWSQPNGTRTFAPGQAVARDAMAAFMHRFDQRGW
ncbi:S-layer homology domain-containing protein [Arthrobacter sp. APC 3897]|uniref:CAP and S-layer homology domain-containing protein n=1 Tax=Arthrobacter sp. APC 3897 TaxID=3035204 RepID=UPI0025B5A59A|nr:S-layer homology domain-containing protein [Arthrobacter sp. APC 3897]MDN3483561.1 S-layer homology domain-containing protein [Arthrobacter sp. APC 3897]